jgi:hypothetical protein
MENSRGDGVAASAVGRSEPTSLSGEDDSAELFPQYFQNVFDDHCSTTTGTGTSGDNGGGPIGLVRGGGVADATLSPDNDNNTLEENEEDFLIQQTAQRLSRANHQSNNSGTSFESHLDGSMSSQETLSIMRKPWHDERHDGQRRLMEVEM